MSRKPRWLTAPERLPLGPDWTNRAERQIRRLVLFVHTVRLIAVYAAWHLIHCLVSARR
jgi:hypothetical protein